MGEYKKLVPGIRYANDQTMTVSGQILEGETSLKELCRHLNDNGADALFFYDDSDTDEAHEEAIGALKEMVRTVDAPVVAGGYIKRLEDVKKYLYAGASAVFLDSSVEENIDVLKEAADRFGSEKIYMWVSDTAALSRLEEFAQLGASLFLFNEAIKWEDAVRALSLSAWILTKDSKQAAVYLKNENVTGVVFTQIEELEADGGCMNYKQYYKQQGIAVDTFESTVTWEQFRLNSDGLIPVIVQDYKTSEVLMLAYMNEEAFQATLHSGKMTYFSRSRQSLWLKGETSGHFQYVKSLHLDCDNDTLLAKVAQVGVACHTGARSCFFQTLVQKDMKETNPLKVFEEVYRVILDRKEHPKEGSYTNYLFDKGLDKILKKLGEEATEIVIAAKNPNPEETKYEISDFLYHAMVLMAVKGLTWEDITEELANR